MASSTKTLSVKDALEFAQHCIEIGHVREAVGIYHNIATQHPEHAVGYAKMADICYRQNKLKRAAILYRKAISLNDLAYTPAAFYGLSNCHRYEKAEVEERDAMEVLLKNKQLPEASRVLLLFALGKVYQDQEDYQRAAGYFAQGNQLQCELLGKNNIHYRPPLYNQFLQDSKTAFSEEILSTHHQQAVVTGRPIFIVGMPRSGTTLVEQIITSHSGVASVGESTAMLTDVIQPIMSTYGKNYPTCLLEMPEAQWACYGEAYLKAVGQHVNGNDARVVDKSPYNFKHLGLIYSLFSDVKIIHCQRNPKDTCLSNWTMLFNHNSGHAQMYSEEHLAHFYEHYQGIMAHWQAVIPKTHLYTLEYEKLVSDPKQFIPELIKFLGLEWEAECLDFQHNHRYIETANSWRVHQPLDASAVGRWQHYREPLAQLFTLLDNR